MRYLKTYNESHSPLSETIEYIKDICLELKDEGFSIGLPNDKTGRMDDIYSLDYGDVVSLNSSRFDITIDKFEGNSWSPYHKFEISDVYHTICTIIGYMESNGYKISVKINSEDMTQAAMKTNLNDITVIFNAVRSHMSPPSNLNGLGRVRYIKLYFTKI